MNVVYETSRSFRYGYKGRTYRTYRSSLYGNTRGNTTGAVSTFPTEHNLAILGSKFSIYRAFRQMFSINHGTAILPRPARLEVRVPDVRNVL